MAEAENVWDNMFVEPKLSECKKEMDTDQHNGRFRLLDYDDVMKLSAVMETTVPIDGKGNFPSLEVTPSTLVQLVRSSLNKEGIRVASVRLNGSAATHVLSDDGKHPYKDLDLIFSIDLSEYNDCSASNCLHSEYNDNSSNSNSYCKTKGYKTNGKKTQSCRTNGLLKPAESETSTGKISSAASADDEADPTPSSVLIKDIADEDEEVDLEDKESGYTSSGSSVSSLPISPSGSWSYQNPVRSRTHSLDSSSSVTSSSSVQHGIRCKESQQDARQRSSGQRKSEQHELCSRSKDSCWQKIKSVVMTILRELLPVGVKSSRMTDAIVTDAYVQKMVKITNDVDRWSLISLNNDAGRNLELKFVDRMRRQYEFSVDSFQIILDSYQRFKIASRRLEGGEAIDLSPHFFPSVMAESVYGDIDAALRHLRHRRICTKRPEEIRGGGLLRYCNLRVRDFTPGEVEGYENDGHDTPTERATMMSQSERAMSAGDVQSYSTSNPEAVKKLEQLMCSRFFIDFSEFDRQQWKLQSYLNSHFQSEEDLKFQYLLIVGNVVDRGNVCLMSNERAKILNYIRKLALDVLSVNVNNSPKSNIKTVVTPPSPHRDPTQRTSPCYQPPHPQNHYQHSTCAPNPSQLHYSQYPAAGNTCPQGYYYLPQQHYYPEPGYYPQCEGDAYYNHATQMPVAVCPCCQSTYVSQGVGYPFAVEHSSVNPLQTMPPSYNPTVECAQINPPPGTALHQAMPPMYTPTVQCTQVKPATGKSVPHQTMSPSSRPFIPSSKCNVTDVTPVTSMKVIYLGENDKLIYTAAPAENSSTVDPEESTTESKTQS